MTKMLTSSWSKCGICIPTHREDSPTLTYLSPWRSNWAWRPHDSPRTTVTPISLWKDSQTAEWCTFHSIWIWNTFPACFSFTPNCDWWDVHCFVLCVQVLSECIKHSSLLIKMLDSNYMCNWLPFRQGFLFQVLPQGHAHLATHSLPGRTAYLCHSPNTQFVAHIRFSL